MPMKALIPSLLTGAVAFFVVAQKPSSEQAPPGAAEKISQALPDKAYAKPEKNRKLLVFSKTNGYICFVSKLIKGFDLFQSTVFVCVIALL